MPPQKLDIFGFSIPILSGGRRIWQPRFKRFITDKMDAGELTVRQVTEVCQVSKSLVYQWRMQARGPPVTASDWRAQTAFSQIVVDESAPEGCADEGLRLVEPACIHLRGKVSELILPVDYPVNDLLRLVRALEGTTA